MLLLDTEIAVVDATIIQILKGMADDAHNKRSRACMAHTDSPMQEMVIVLKEGSYIRPHRHPRGKSESYHIIEGELLVKVFTPDGQTYREIVLNKTTPFYRLKGGWYHQPKALTDYAVYHECYTGPFEKATDVQYADWAAQE